MPISAPSRFQASFGAVYTMNVVLSAFCLFQVEPIIAKLILPWFGGAVGVWSVCMLFFQSLLLLGYVYAHLLTEGLHRRYQAVIHIVLLLASLAVLPILPAARWKPSGLESPSFRILVVLTASVGLPYFMLSSTSPLLQAWYAKSGRNSHPYRLYAFSNVGSLVGLLSYPLLVEPFLSNRHQAITWSALYGIFTVAAIAVTLLRGVDRTPHEVGKKEARIGWNVKILWVALAACGSALMLSVTNQICQNIAAIPFLWVIPLSVYLVTLILTFETDGRYKRPRYLKVFALTLAAMVYALSPRHSTLPPLLVIFIFCVGLFASCMICHGELARLKPSSSQLTSFYLLVSLGGAMGSVFVALIAPHVFSGYYELPIALGLCGLLIHIVIYREARSETAAPIVSSRFPVTAALAIVLCIGVYVTKRQQSTYVQSAARNFYGVLKVEDHVLPEVVSADGAMAEATNRGRYRELVNGTIEHGIQFLALGRQRQATTYYGTQTGVGLALLAAQRDGPVKVGVIGLGVGTLATYGRPGDQYTFFEINPLVVSLAYRDFTFLEASLARTRVVLGDGRLSLEREPDQHFDVLAVDAFSGDAIPTHLLTQEAIRLYLRHLSPAGVIAVHVSNKYLNLIPVVSAAAASLNQKALVINSPGDASNALFPATWVLVGPETGLLSHVERSASGEIATTPECKSALWTDNYSSVVRTFRW